jgi:hypothetical protein
MKSRVGVVEKERTRISKRDGRAHGEKQPDAAVTATQEIPADGKSSGVTYASDAQFRKAHRKTNSVHAGLFRRLAE